MYSGADDIVTFGERNRGQEDDLAGLGAQLPRYVDAIAGFRCFEPGAGQVGDFCARDVTFEGDIVCGAGLMCVEGEDGGTCALTCRRP